MDVGLRIELAARVVLEQGIGQMAGAKGITLGVVDIGAPSAKVFSTQPIV
jgi:hypothetical protein